MIRHMSAEVAGEPLARRPAQLTDRADAQGLEPCSHLLPDAPDAANRQRVQHGLLRLLRDDDEPVRLLEI